MNYIKSYQLFMARQIYIRRALLYDRDYMIILCKS